MISKAFSSRSRPSAFSSLMPSRSLPIAVIRSWRSRLSVSSRLSYSAASSSARRLTAPSWSRSRSRPDSSDSAPDASAGVAMASSRSFWPNSSGVPPVCSWMFAEISSALACAASRRARAPARASRAAAASCSVVRSAPSASRRVLSAAFSVSRASARRFSAMAS